MKDAIGERMKSQYEDRTRFYLPRRTYTILRVDGKAFHSYCRKMERPYDRRFMYVMDTVASEMLQEIMGAEFAYTQSDEISFLLTDFAKPSTEAWFDGNIQKMASVAAGLATGFFNALMLDDAATIGTFDARVFTIPDYVEVENYFIWRQQDAVRNSILMLAQHYYSPKEMHGKSCSVLQEMIHQKGDNWNNHPARFKRGGMIWYNRETKPYPSWQIDEAPIFTGKSERQQFAALIPKHWENKETA